MRTFLWLPDKWSIEGFWCVVDGKEKWFSQLCSPPKDISINHTYKIINQRKYDLGFVDPNDQEKLKEEILNLIEKGTLRDFNFKKEE